MDFELYKNAIMQPKPTFAKEVKNASVGAAAKNFAIAGLLGGIVTAIFTLGAGIFAIPFMLVLMIIAGFIGAGITHILASLLGGKGEFKDIAYLSSLYLVLLVPLSSIPLVGFLASLYGLYLLYLAVMQEYKLSSAKAAAVVLIPIIIAIVLAMIFAAALATLVLGGILAGKAAGY